MIALEIIVWMFCTYIPFTEQVMKQKRKSSNPHKSPIIIEREALQILFLKEIETGESLIFEGDLESSVEHFVNAVVICGEPSELLSLLKQILPTSVFNSVIINIILLTE